MLATSEWTQLHISHEIVSGKLNLVEIEAVRRSE